MQGHYFYIYNFRATTITITTSDDRRFSDHRPGFGSTARQGDFPPGVFRDFPGISVFSRYFSGFPGIFRYFSVFFGIFRQGQRPWREPRAQGTARHLKAPPGQAVRFSVYDQHWP